MTMRVMFLEDSHGYKAGKEAFIERSLGIRLYEKNICMPYTIWEKQRKAQLLEEKEKIDEIEAVSVLEKTKEKAVKKRGRSKKIKSILE